MTLRNQLKNVNIQNAETIQSYFTRVSHIKEQLEAIDEEVENAEIVMTTLNGVAISWDSFIQGICARKKLVKFNKLWEECSQEEARIAAREEKMGSEDQALHYIPRKPKEVLITPEVSVFIKLTLENISLEEDVILVMK